jgi:hypothetical protein
MSWFSVKIKVWSLLIEAYSNSRFYNLRTWVLLEEYLFLRFELISYWDSSVSGLLLLEINEDDSE